MGELSLLMIVMYMNHFSGDSNGNFFQGLIEQVDKCFACWLCCWVTLGSLFL